MPPDPTPHLCLASASPRRRALLEDAGFRVQVRAAAVAEDRRPGEDPVALARRLAADKAQAVRDRLQREAGAAPLPVVLAADTVVHARQRVFDKPGDADEALRILAALAGRWHQVTTGFCILAGSRCIVDHASTRVRFRDLDAATLRRYAATGESLDKAGAYGIQGRGAVLVDRVEGSYTNVVGLPLAEVVHRLAEVGVLPAQHAATEAS